MAYCALCSVETSFMNASVGKLSDGGSVCRNCFKKITKLKPSINIKKYSFEDINNILLGKEVERPTSKVEERKTTENSVDTKLDAKTIIGLISGIFGLYLLYQGIKYLFFN